MFDFYQQHPEFITDNHIEILKKGFMKKVIVARFFYQFKLYWHWKSFNTEKIFNFWLLLQENFSAKYDQYSWATRYPHSLETTYYNSCDPDQFPDEVESKECQTIYYLLGIAKVLETKCRQTYMEPCFHIYDKSKPSTNFVGEFIKMRFIYFTKALTILQ